MIGVQGQYLISFGLNSTRDFIREEDFRSFMVREEAGNNLPTFKLEFDTDGSNLGQLNEMSDLTISMGEDMATMVQTQLYITEVTMGRVGNRRRVSCQGMLAQPGYLNNTRTGITGKKSGVEVVRSVASRYFRFDSNIQASADQQNWIQNNIADKMFLNNAWLRSHVPGSWLATGISALDNTFILRDMRNHAKGNPVWKFLPHDTPASSYEEITYSGDYSVRNNSGFVNSTLGGYGIDMPAFNIDQGLSSFISGLASPLLSAASSFAQRGLEGGLDAVRKGLYTAKTANMHDNYHQAYSNNIRNLALFSSFKVTLNFERKFRPVRVLDPVYFLEDSEQTPGQAEYASGNYVITKVDRVFTNRQHGTRIELSREGPGGI